MLAWMALFPVDVPDQWAGLLALGLFIGLLTGLFGVGGGFLMTPCLKVLFGLPYPLAVGSSLGAIFFTGSISAYRHHRHGNVAFRLGLLMTAGALTGTLGGKFLMSRLQRLAPAAADGLPVSDLVLSGLFLFLLVVVALVVVWESRKPVAHADEEPPSAMAVWLRRLRGGPRIPVPRAAGGATISVWIPTSMGLFVGVLTGLLGVGGGFVMFPILVFGLGVPTVVAVGTGAFQLVFASGLGMLLYARMGQVGLATVAMLVCGSWVGAELGARLAMRMKARRLKRYFNLVVLAGVGVVLYDLLRNARVF